MDSVQQFLFDEDMAEEDFKEDSAIKEVAKLVQQCPRTACGQLD